MSLREEACVAIEMGINSAWPLERFKPTEAECALDALLVFLKEHDRKQRKMEWPFSFAEYLKMLSGDEQ